MPHKTNADTAAIYIISVSFTNSGFHIIGSVASCIKGVMQSGLEMDFRVPTYKTASEINEDIKRQLTLNPEYTSISMEHVVLFGGAMA